MALLDQLDIVNAACSLCGAEPLQDVSEESVGGQAAALLYQQVVDFNLTLEPFEFALEHRQLSRVAGDAPSSGYLYVYNVPGEILGPPRWFTDDPSDPSRRYSAYALITGQVHADAEALWAYVHFRPEPWRWSAPFRAATITALAAQLALSLASDNGTSEMLYLRAYGPPSENHRGGLMRAAITLNSQATPPRPAPHDNNPLTRAWRS